MQLCPRCCTLRNQTGARVIVLACWWRLQPLLHVFHAAFGHRVVNCKSCHSFIQKTAHSCCQAAPRVASVLNVPNLAVTPDTIVGIEAPADLAR